MTDAKTAAISGRISQEDYDFLMGHPIAGTVTISEKLRHVCHFFRAYHETSQRYPDSLAQLQGFLQTGVKNLKDAENRQALHSELVDRLVAALPEAMALLATFRRPDRKDEELKALLHAEERLLQWAMQLLEGILRMGLTTRAPAYNPALLRGKLETAGELLDMLRSRPGK